MDPEYSNTKKIYEVKNEYDPDDDKKFHHVKLDDIAKKPQSMCRISMVIGLLILSVVLLLIVILQSVTIAHLNLLPVVCPEEAATASPATDALTGTTDDYRQTQDAINMQMLSQMSRIINMSENIMETGNKLFDTSIDIYGTSQDILSISDDHYTYSQNNTDWIWQILETTQGSAQKLYEIVHTLSNIKDSNIATEVVVNDILMIVEELLRLQNDSLIFSSDLPISCQDIKNKQPDSPSGYYHINSKLVYCEMGELCNSTGGGWTRIAYLDMSDATVDCPTGFKLYDKNGIRSCGRPDIHASCVSQNFSSNGISYSQVCGRVTGYQVGGTDAIGYNPHNIDTFYVDGVSITQGSPRQHVWTMIAGILESMTHGSNCPCNVPAPNGQVIPSFVGNDYFCESAGVPLWQHYFTGDPLWDGKQCGSHEEEKCCLGTTVPWFHKTLNTTTDYIEMRVCSDESNVHEDIPVGFYELYVK